MRRPYPPEVDVVVTFETRSQACRARVERGTERIESVRLLGRRLRVHLDRVDSLAGNGAMSEG